ncbi:MAG: YlbF family regulator [Gemmatimonadetes bacterium]|nr:MAG: YlbF family regulator [Gemmatimonadota bacterium]
MERLLELAKSLGEGLGRTDEYQALKRAIEAVNGDRELAELRTELERLEAEITQALRAQQEPAEETRKAYEDAVSRLQASPVYQRLVAAQANFDKILQKVNQTIEQGIQDGAESRIILP